MFASNFKPPGPGEPNVPVTGKLNDELFRFEATGTLEDLQIRVAFPGDIPEIIYRCHCKDRKFTEALLAVDSLKDPKLRSIFALQVLTESATAGVITELPPERPAGSGELIRSNMPESLFDILNRTDKKWSTVRFRPEGMEHELVFCQSIHRPIPGAAAFKRHFWINYEDKNNFKTFKLSALAPHQGTADWWKTLGRESQRAYREGGFEAVRNLICDRIEAWHRENADKSEDPFGAIGLTPPENLRPNEGDTLIASRKHSYLEIARSEHFAKIIITPTQNRELLSWAFSRSMSANRPDDKIATEIFRLLATDTLETDLLAVKELIWHGFEPQIFVDIDTLERIQQMEEQTLYEGLSLLKRISADEAEKKMSLMGVQYSPVVNFDSAKSIFLALQGLYGCSFLLIETENLFPATKSSITIRSDCRCFVTLTDNTGGLLVREIEFLDGEQSRFNGFFILEPTIMLLQDPDRFRRFIERASEAVNALASGDCSPDEVWIEGLLPQQHEIYGAVQTRLGKFISAITTIHYPSLDPGGIAWKEHGAIVYRAAEERIGLVFESTSDKASLSGHQLGLEMGFDDSLQITCCTRIHGEGDKASFKHIRYICDPKKSLEIVSKLRRASPDEICKVLKTYAILEPVEYVDRKGIKEQVRENGKEWHFLR